MSELKLFCTPEHTRAELESLRAKQHDDEAAHSLEDVLYLGILEAIADGTCTTPRECAAIAIESSKIDFQRWCA